VPGFLVLRLVKLVKLTEGHQQQHHFNGVMTDGGKKHEIDAENRLFSSYPGYSIAFDDSYLVSTENVAEKCRTMTISVLLARKLKKESMR
jgi:hypothetical protein